MEVRIRSIDHLLTAVQGGVRPSYLFFWGHRPRGRIGKSCLSQWWPCTFEIEGTRYPSAEHWMMAAKARLFGDDEMLAEILGSPSPAEAKQLGRRVRGFEEEVWDAACFELVVKGNLAKFEQNPELRSFLLSTGDQVLVEASPYDRIWGIGMGERDPRARDPRCWEGENLLGFALMEARDRLRAS